MLAGCFLPALLARNGPEHEVGIWFHSQALGCWTVMWSEGGRQHRIATTLQHKDMAKLNHFPMNLLVLINPFLLGGSQVFMLMLWEGGRNSQLLLSAPCGFVNDGKCSQLGRECFWVSLGPSGRETALAPK